MLNSESITRRASEILSAKGLKPELSEQAKAVTLAITEAINLEVLDLQAKNEKQLNAVKETPTGRMKKPTLEEIKLHGAKIGLPDKECDRFFDHFESNGWKVGLSKTPMKLWTAALANWKRTWQERGGKPIGQPAIKLPTEIDVCRYGEQKGASVDFCRSWHLSMTRKNWRVNGKIIDWQIEFSRAFAGQRA